MTAIGYGSGGPGDELIENERAEQHQAGIAVRLEHGKAHCRVGDIESTNLPAEMREVHGVGEAKLKQYGETFLTVIREKLG